MSIQSNLNKVIGGIAGATIGASELKKKGEEEAIKVKEKTAKEEAKTLSSNFETNLANKTIDNQKDYFNKKNNLWNNYKLARIRRKQIVANEFRDSMASMISSNITNPNMPMAEKLELQNKLFEMEDDDIISNLDLFKNSSDKVKSLKDFKLKETTNGNSK